MRVYTYVCVCFCVYVGGHRCVWCVYVYFTGNTFQGLMHFSQVLDHWVTSSIKTLDLEPIFITLSRRLQFGAPAMYIMLAWCWWYSTEHGHSASLVPNLFWTFFGSSTTGDTLRPYIQDSRSGNREMFLPCREGQMSSEIPTKKAKLHLRPASSQKTGLPSSKHSSSS